MRTIYQTSTVTGKRQITIPIEVYEALEISPGDKVLFRSGESGEVYFEVVKSAETCIVCKGNKKIGDKVCCMCSGEGEISSTSLSDIGKYIAYVVSQMIKEKIPTLFISQGVEIPYIKILNTKKYSKEELVYIQDEIQKKVIELVTPKSVNEGMLCCPTDELLNLILNTLSSEKAKDEVKNWFRYDRVPFEVINR